MDPITHAIPDFVVQMSQATRYAAQGFVFGRRHQPHRLPPSLSSLFSCLENPTSKLLKNFYRLLPDVSQIGAPSRCADPLDYYLVTGSFKSMRDRVRQAASTRQRAALSAVAPVDLRNYLDEILISPTSYPLISMTKSDPSHCRRNDIFIIELKRKLHLEIFDPKRCPTCLCGATINPHGKHIFCCR